MPKIEPYCIKHVLVKFIRLVLDCGIYVSKTPNLSRTHDIETSFTLFYKTNPYLSRGLN